MALLSPALLCRGLAPRCSALLGHSSAVPRADSPCHRTALLNIALPVRNVAAHNHAVAAPSIAVLCRALLCFAQPSRAIALPCRALPLRVNSEKVRLSSLAYISTQLLAPCWLPSRFGLLGNQPK
jgi:hypothetical protein